MTVTELNCKNFRNFGDITFRPDPSMNVIFGDNAQGKTNLLEAVWLFCGAKSFRGAKDGELIGFGQNFAVNRCDFVFGGVEKSAKIIIESEKKRKAELAGKPLSSPGELAGNFPCIVFSPLDLNLVNDGPSVRRKFLDTAIGQLYPLYFEKLRKYSKAVNQRNSILRDMKQNPGLSYLLDDFEQTLAFFTAQIMKYRLRYVEILSETAPEIYSGLSGEREKLTFSYQSKISAGATAEEIQRQLHACRKEDILTGNTSIGPHRDDLELFLNDNRLKSFGSQGQRRSVALTLKLAEARILKRITGEYPVALLDDVMSELDTGRQEFILNHIRDWQVFITCCDPGTIGGLKNGAVFSMREGCVSGQTAI